MRTLPVAGQQVGADLRQVGHPEQRHVSADFGGQQLDGVPHACFAADRGAFPCDQLQPPRGLLALEYGIGLQRRPDWSQTRTRDA